MSRVEDIDADAGEDRHAREVPRAARAARSTPYPVFTPAEGA